MQVMLMRLMSKGEYLIVPKGTKFKGSGKLGLNDTSFVIIAESLTYEKSVFLRGYCTPDQFCDCLCIYLKNYNTLVTSNICGITLE